jgi:hypothetical protein
MEAIEVIQIIDDLKSTYQPAFMQDKLNRWKRLAIELDTEVGFNEELFESELKTEALIIKEILNKIEYDKIKKS